MATAQTRWNDELLKIIKKTGANISILHAEGSGKESVERRNINISGTLEATSAATSMVRFHIYNRAHHIQSLSVQIARCHF
jgi:hypothetical protein